MVEMEALGVPQRTINALEISEFKIITLEQLMNFRKEDLMTIQNVGVKALNQLFGALNRYHELDQILEEDNW